MDDRDLLSTELLDCHGHVSHRLVLELDGSVRIVWASGTVARVAPRTGRILTPGVQVDSQLLSAARALGG